MHRYNAIQFLSQLSWTNVALQVIYIPLHQLSHLLLAFSKFSFLMDTQDASAALNKLWNHEARLAEREKKKVLSHGALSHQSDEDVNYSADNPRDVYFNKNHLLSAAATRPLSSIMCGVGADNVSLADTQHVSRFINAGIQRHHPRHTHIRSAHTRQTQFSSLW